MGDIDNYRHAIAVGDVTHLQNSWKIPDNSTLYWKQLSHASMSARIRDKMIAIKIKTKFIKKRTSYFSNSQE
jgi:hypothetical protein